MHRRYGWGRLGAKLEAGVWVARKSRIILGHFRALEPLLHVEYDGLNMAMKIRPFLYDVAHR